MSTAYILREGFSGFQRAKLSMTISIITICIALILLAIFAIVTSNANRLIDSIRNRVELEVFLEEPVTQTVIDSLRMQIQQVKGIDTLRFVSKEEAARVFKQEFGEDITSVLNFNPLPPSFKISLKNGYKTAAHVEAISKRISAIPGITDIIYRKSLLEFLDKRTKTVFLITLSLGLIISLSAIMLVSNTIRLAIYSKRAIIETMKLVGATRSFIRTPFIIEGIIQGFIGGVVATGIVFGLVLFAQKQLTAELADILIVDPMLYALIAAAGIFLGMIGSMISIRRFLSKSFAG
ncbi:MAG: permease-like cell division protein FtsX [Bacteroidota bacterium]